MRSVGVYWRVFACVPVPRLVLTSCGSLVSPPPSPCLLFAVLGARCLVCCSPMTGCFSISVVVQHENTRQCCVYGVGQAIMHAPDMVRSSVPDILARLMAVIQAPDARSDDNCNATENAISTLGPCTLHARLVAVAVHCTCWGGGGGLSLRGFMCSCWCNWRGAC